MDLFCKKRKSHCFKDSIDAIVNFKNGNIYFNILKWFLAPTGFAIRIQLDESVDV